MPRTLFALLLLPLLAAAQERIEKGPRSVPPIELRSDFQRGQRFAGSNSVSYTVTTSIKQGDKEETKTEAMEHTERFLDKIVRSGAGVLEIERNYLKLFTKQRASEDGRPEIYQNPLQGQTIMLKERGRRREMRIEAQGTTVDSLVRRTAGMELDWRDIFPEEAVAPGDAWNADTSALARRLSAYLNCGTRGGMRVRFEEILEEDGARQAKLYIDLTLEGMRDRNLFTKVSLAGDVYFDLGLKRVVGVDLVGNMVVRGAIIGKGAPVIVRGQGPVLLKSTLKDAQLDASAGSED